MTLLKHRLAEVQMNALRKSQEPFLVAALFAIIIVAFWTLSPTYIPVPHRDSGIFLNIGSEILRGKILYLQTWDNKQPLLYFINAAGLWLGGGSIWGVWSLELALFLIGMGSAYAMLRRTLTSWLSFVVVAISFLTTFQVMSGNFSEEYAVVFQVAILAVLFLFYLPARNPKARSWAAVAMGI